MLNPFVMMVSFMFVSGDAAIICCSSAFSIFMQADAMVLNCRRCRSKFAFFRATCISRCAPLCSLVMVFGQHSSGALWPLL